MPPVDAGSPAPTCTYDVTGSPEERRTLCTRGSVRCICISGRCYVCYPNDVCRTPLPTFHKMQMYAKTYDKKIGYVTTPIAMVQAGVTILKEPSSLPKKGGVYTPGAAFSKTKLIERLDKAGIHLSVISKTEA
ncbi:saccharopine dehydrogenase-like oxidoreductase [Pseudophryne corroboree]|uniref:saccharopine dehydrogenase-like oxidoreductase n=1 Tax=Pseudophryne corroboree TaxID=495146 RepID=UPI003081B2CE